MRRLTLLLVWICLSSPCSAEEDLWVLGSFSREDNAIAQKNSLEQRLDVPVRILYSNKRSAYRLVASAVAISASTLRESGLDPWLMPGLSDQANATLLIQNAKSTPDTPVVSRETDWSPLYPELAPNETIPDYCQRLPDSPLCTDPLSEEVLKRAKKLAEQAESLSNACNEIANPDHKATCLEIHGTK